MVQPSLEAPFTEIDAGDCSWQTTAKYGDPWDSLVAFLVTDAFTVTTRMAAPCPPLEPATKPGIVAYRCYP